MREKIVTMWQWGKKRVEEWWQLVLVTIELIISPHQRTKREKFAATFARIDVVPIVEALTDFLGDLPLWFY
ncbi:MAG: hypothetical protein RMK91_09890 [Pseudanabaenaceae cyanobacterium SKYGB_i_bin29]|nr:hypothetical protein [Pseudanabaenaceae cyanobacterium SKYG29]MDW8422164.1 hypothetical protein [Pseudanabaenaceae cyanobacterium SKYGB_i_bin29]